MSRSYRKPYAAVTGCRSAADDKRIARRACRRLQNRVLKALNLEHEDEFMIPVRYEAADNDVWGWGRDGNQSLHFSPVLTWDIYRYNVCRAWTEEQLIENEIEWFNRDLKYYERLKRK